MKFSVTGLMIPKVLAFALVILLKCRISRHYQVAQQAAFIHSPPPLTLAPYYAKFATGTVGQG